MPNPDLTPRELDVLRCAADGLSVKLTAARLGISYGTVKDHRHHILEKLDARTMTRACALGFQQGWIE